MTEDHPYDYASFEGVIPPKQYGAGEVIVWDCGPYTPDEDRKGHWYHDRAHAERLVREGIAAGKLSVTLRGAKLKGSFALVRTARNPKDWLLIKHKDRFVAETGVTEKDQSVLSGLMVENLKALPVRRLPASQLVPSGKMEALPVKLLPMLAELRDAPFPGAGWMWEPKLDGYRVLAFIDDKEVKLRSRRGLDLTASFPSLAAELAQQAVKGLVLDGEITAFGADGRPSFAALQERVQLKTEREFAAADRATPVVFFCFDLLHFAGLDTRGAPYADRRRWLEQCLLPSPHVQLVHAEEDGEALYKAGLARPARGPPPRLLGRGQAALLRARRVGVRRAHARAGEGALREAANRRLPVCGETGATQPDDLGEARARRGSGVPAVDPGRDASRSGVPAAARRRRSEIGAP